jgi:hypothetical protein
MVDTTIDQITELGLECQLVGGEYRISYPGANELDAYYAPSAADAVEAAKAMYDLMKGLA